MTGFTTSPERYIKRGNKTIRARCLEFVETLAIQQIKELPLEQAQQFFSLEIIDLWDTRTLAKYFGTQAHRNTKKIECQKQYATGFVSSRNITLTQDIHKRIGYLEKLGLVHYEQRGKTVFIVLENRALIPELVKGCVSKGNLYITHKGEYYRNLQKHPIPKNVVVNRMATSMQLGSHVDSETKRSEREYIGGDTNRSS